MLYQGIFENHTPSAISMVYLSSRWLVHGGYPSYDCGKYLFLCSVVSTVESGVLGPAVQVASHIGSESRRIECVRCQAPAVQFVTYNEGESDENFNRLLVLCPVLIKRLTVGRCQRCRWQHCSQLCFLSQTDGQFGNPKIMLKSQKQAKQSSLRVWKRKIQRTIKVLTHITYDAVVCKATTDMPFRHGFLHSQTKLKLF